MSFSPLISFLSVEILKNISEELFFAHNVILPIQFVCISNCMFLRAIWDKEPKLVFNNMMKFAIS